VKNKLNIFFLILLIALFFLGLQSVLASPLAQKATATPRTTASTTAPKPTTQPTRTPARTDTPASTPRSSDTPTSPAGGSGGATATSSTAPAQVSTSNPTASNQAGAAGISTEALTPTPGDGNTETPTGPGALAPGGDAPSGVGQEGDSFPDVVYGEQGRIFWNIILLLGIAVLLLVGFLLWRAFRRPAAAVSADSDTQSDPEWAYSRYFVLDASGVEMPLWVKISKPAKESNIQRIVEFRIEAAESGDDSRTINLALKALNSESGASGSGGGTFHSFESGILVGQAPIGDRFELFFDGSAIPPDTPSEATGQTPGRYKIVLPDVVDLDQFKKVLTALPAEASASADAYRIDLLAQKTALPQETVRAALGGLAEAIEKAMAEHAQTSPQATGQDIILGDDGMWD